VSKAPIEIVRVSDTAAFSRSLIDPLIAASEREGCDFVSRFARDWESGCKRFDLPGEALFLAQSAESVLGVCGLNRDPYTGSGTMGRLRHLYVLPPCRRRGVGKLLTEAALRHAEGRFLYVRLRAGPRGSHPFYAALGFSRLSDPNATHWLRVCEARSG
jgi:GNAT superfamily N-acetyltransferase